MAQNVVGDRANNGSKAVSVVFSSMKPWLYVEATKGNDAVQFYKAAFGAEEVIRVNHPKRKAEQELPLILAAELKLGSCTFIVSDLTDEGSSLYVDKFSFTCSSSLFVHKTPYAFTLGYITLVHIIFMGPARLHDILCDICICVLVL